MSKNFSCGIDFGTSNSTCAVYNGKSILPVPMENSKEVIPSALFFSHEGHVYFGREAINLYIDGEEGRLLRGLKSILGTSLMIERTIVGKKSRTFEDILAIYISNLKSKAEQYLQSDIEKVVLGRPVHFHDNNPDADAKSEDMLRNIATSIGFKDIHFLYEPIAAAYSHEQTIEDEQIAVVVDLGGGTSDFTVIRLSADRKTKADRKEDILSTTGVRIGGVNFDKALSIASFMPYLGLGSEYRSEFDESKFMTIPSNVYNDLSDWPFIHQVQSRKAIAETKALLRTASEPEKLQRLLEIQKEHLGHAFLQVVEHAKIELTNADYTISDLSELGLDFTVKSTREEFMQSIDLQVERIKQAMNECVSSSGYKPSDIGLVILTGGSSEIPIINKIVNVTFPNAQISKDDKFGSVGRGLAYNAANLFKD